MRVGGGKEMECNFVLLQFQGYFRYYSVVLKMIRKGFIKLSDKKNDGILRDKVLRDIMNQ